MEFFPALYDRERSERSAAIMRQRLAADGYGCWAVEVKGGVSFAGVIALQDVPAEMPFSPAFEIGWRFAFDTWGNGYATEAAEPALRFAFENLEHAEVVALTATINRRSRRVMEKLGMTYDPAGDFRHPSLEPGHRLERHVLYRLGRAAFRDARSPRHAR